MTQTAKFIKRRDEFLEYQSKFNMLNMKQVDINKLRLLALRADIETSDWREKNIINSLVSQTLGADL